MHSDEVSHDKHVTVLRIVRVVVMAVSLLLLVMFLMVALKRLRYPFELDRMESAMMTTVWRLTHGMPIYVRPSLEWVPFLYTPVYFYLSALAARFTGLNYAALRLVSTLATVGSCGLIYAFVARETKRKDAALASMGLFVGLYGYVLGWYDIGRVDSLSVFFFLLALFCMRFSAFWVAAIVWVVAFQTKQGFLPIAVLAFAVDWQRPKRMLLGVGTFAVLAAVSVVMLNHSSAGWYSYYVFGTVSTLHLKLRLAGLYLPFDLVAPLGVMLALIALAWMLKPPSWRSSGTVFYGLLTVLIVGGIGYARAHEGGYVNALIPMYAWMAVIFGLAIHRVLEWAETMPAKAMTATLSAIVWVMVLVQLTMHLYRPGEYSSQAGGIPGRMKFMDQLRAMPGDVWVVNHSWDGIQAGKGMHAEMDALDAVLNRKDEATIREVKQAYASRRFTAVVLDRVAATYEPEWLFQGSEFAAQYPMTAFAAGAAMPDAGDQPVMLYLPCDTDQEAKDTMRLNHTYIKLGACKP